MKQQHALQKQIVARYKQLGITGQLPAFQGNVPVGLKALKKDANMTARGSTGWLDAMDPLYAEIADAWMERLVADFGTQHWCQCGLSDFRTELLPTYRKSDDLKSTC